MKKKLLFLGIMAIGLLTACSKGGNKVSTIEIMQNQEYIYAPHIGETTVAEAFSIQYTTEENKPLVSWEILSSTKGVSIDNGKLTLTDDYVSGDINGTDITVRATAEDGSTAEATLHVREPKRVGAFEIDLPDYCQKGERLEVRFANVKDQYGEEYSFDVKNVEWQFTANGLEYKEKYNQLWTDIDTIEKTFVGIRCTVDGVTAEKRMVLHGDRKFVPSEEDLEAVKTAELKYLSDVDFSVAKAVDASLYSLTMDVKGKTEVTVNVNGLKSFAANQIYQVSVLNTDGSLTSADYEADAKGEIKLTLADAEKIEVSPVFRFALASAVQGDDTSYTKVSIMERYTGVEDYGFYGPLMEMKGGVTFRSEEAFFVATLPEGFYNIRITKPQSGTGRSTVRINGASLGTNVGNPGQGERTGVVPYTYLMEDVCVEGGSARISYSEKDYTLAAVEIRKTTSLVPRRVHLYIGGDSTVSNYYPIETEIPAPGRAQTGWGQVFVQYTSDEIAVTNIAGGGTYAKSWYELAFPGVVQNGQPGDYFIIHAGINDKSYSNADEMCEYLTKMIDECEAKGITVILATAMQSPKFWRNSTGKDLDEFGTPEGGGLAMFMEAIRKLAKDKNVFLVDVGKMTGEWYSVVGRTYVAQNYHLYNTRTGKEEDTLHLSYMGAMKVAELIATDIVRQQSEKVTDHLGHNLDGLKFNELTTYTVTHQDAKGNTVDTEVTGVKAVYKRYAE